MSATAVLAGLGRAWRLSLPFAKQRQSARLPAGPVGLGIEGLPHGVGQMPKATASALLLCSPLDWQAWVPALLVDWLQAGPVLLLGAGAADIDAVLAQAEFAAAYASGRLRVWILPTEAQRRLRRDGLLGLTQELRRAGHEAGVSLCLLDANAMLEGANVRQLRRLGGQLRRWSARLPMPVALLFPLFRQSPGSAEADQTGAAARVVVSTFDQVAQLCTTSEGRVLTLHRWDAAGAAVVQARYHLRLAPMPGTTPQRLRLHYAGSYSQGESPVLAQAPDMDVVYTSMLALAGQIRVPPSWQVLPSLQAVQEAAAHAVGATVLLHAGEPEEFGLLARVVHQLRLSRPRSLKILVRETGSRLRAHNEQALLHLGATAIVYRELGFARLLRVIEEHQGVMHNREVNKDSTAILQACQPAPLRGYLPPLEFVIQVKGMVERTHAAGLEHGLVQLPLLPHVAHLDALRACRLLRDGDLLCADAEGLYLFLFACTQADLDAVLARMWALPLEQCFGAQRVDVTYDGIQATLGYLFEMAPNLPDYSALLEPTPAAGPDPAADPAADPAGIPAVGVPVGGAGVRAAAGRPALALKLVPQPAVQAAAGPADSASDVEGEQDEPTISQSDRLLEPARLRACPIGRVAVPAAAAAAAAAASMPPLVDSRHAPASPPEGQP